MLRSGETAPNTMTREQNRSREPVGATTYPRERVEDSQVLRNESLRATPEPFVSADEAAQFLCVKRRYLLELARRGIAGAYALGTGGKLSELAVSVVRNETSIPKPAKPCTIGSGSPR